jgi:hypothetical protein
MKGNVVHFRNKEIKIKILNFDDIKHFEMASSQNFNVHYLVDGLIPSKFDIKFW